MAASLNSVFLQLKMLKPITSRHFYPPTFEKPENKKMAENLNLNLTSSHNQTFFTTWEKHAKFLILWHA
jgi:hypothetical protein